MAKVSETVIVELESIDEATLVDCDSCCRGMVEARHMRPIVDCVLSPGDLVPAGRCPICGNLVYPVGPIGKAAA